MPRASIAAKATTWIAVAGAVIATLSFAHNSLGEVRDSIDLGKRTAVRVDSLEVKQQRKEVWDAAIGYMVCSDFARNHSRTEVPAICGSATR